jgi:hypothetical protein
VWGVSNSFTYNSDKVIFNAKHAARKIIAKEAGRADGKMKKPDKADKAVEMMAEEKHKLEERISKISYVEVYFKSVAKYYNQPVGDRLLCVKLPEGGGTGGAALDGGSLPPAVLEQVRAACSKKQLELIDAALLNDKLDNLFQLGKMKDLAAFTPIPKQKIEDATPIEDEDESGPSGTVKAQTTSIQPTQGGEIVVFG